MDITFNKPLSSNLLNICENILSFNILKENRMFFNQFTNIRNEYDIKDIKDFFIEIKNNDSYECLKKIGNYSYFFMQQEKLLDIFPNINKEIFFLHSVYFSKIYSMDFEFDKNGMTLLDLNNVYSNNQLAQNSIANQLYMVIKFINTIGPKLFKFPCENIKINCSLDIKVYKDISSYLVEVTNNEIYCITNNKKEKYIDFVPNRNHLEKVINQIYLYDNLNDNLNIKEKNQKKIKI